MRHFANLVTLVMLGVSMVTGEKSALLVIDVQNCFTGGGTLEVAGGDEVIPVINSLRDLPVFSLVMHSQDWHCADHVSFASQHPGKDVYDVITLNYSKQGELCAETCSADPTTLEQVLWPDHCVINTTDAALRDDLITKPQDVVVRKGYNCDLDSYSVFYDNGALSETSANHQLQEAGITDLYIVGLARDYCVYWSAKDALQLGYKTYVIVDATRPVAKETGDSALEDMENLGIHLVNSTDLLDDASGAAVTMVTSSWVVWLLIIPSLVSQCWCTTVRA